MVLWIILPFSGLGGKIFSLPFLSCWYCLIKKTTIECQDGPVSLGEKGEWLCEYYILVQAP